MLFKKTKVYIEKIEIKQKVADNFCSNDLKYVFVYEFMCENNSYTHRDTRMRELLNSHINYRFVSFVQITRDGKKYNQPFACRYHSSYASRQENERYEQKQQEKEIFLYICMIIFFF